MNGKYRVTVLTPLLAGSGEQWTPIDYMVWQNEVRVLDQERIFKLLARNPRLESYLGQLRRGERLEWSLWGGYAQSYSSLKIPFASGGLAGVWEKARMEDLHIPRFAHAGGRRILPGSAIKGALRTAWLGGVINPERARELWIEGAAAGPRWRPSAQLETAAPNRAVAGMAFSDARTPQDSFRVYQTRTLVLRGPQGKSGPSEWKPGQQFVEMARAGSVFEGRGSAPAGVLDAAKLQSRRWIQQNEEFAKVAGLKPLSESVTRLKTEEAATGESSCLLQVGWGGGFGSKVLAPDLATPEARMALSAIPGIRKSVVPGLPFPKTRRIVLDGAGGAALCGWVKLEFF